MWRRACLVVCILGASGCHLVTGIDDYGASLFVGEWGGVTALLGRKPSMAIFGDHTGDGTIPLFIFDETGGSPGLVDVGIVIQWQETDEADYFTLVATCGDRACADNPFSSTWGCDVDNGGQNLVCTILGGTQLTGTDVIEFRRTD